MKQLQINCSFSQRVRRRTKEKKSIFATVQIFTSKDIFCCFCGRNLNFYLLKFKIILLIEKLNFLKIKSSIIILLKLSKLNPFFIFVGISLLISILQNCRVGTQNCSLFRHCIESYWHLKELATKQLKVGAGAYDGSW